MVTNKINSNLTLKEKILKHLIENKDKKESINQASGAIVADYKNTFNAINSFPQDLISIEKIGNSNIINLNLIPHQEIFNIENKRTKEFLEKNKKIKLIQEDILSINYPFFIVLAFGSYVKKTETKNSDIDICIISDNKEKAKELISRINLFPAHIEVHDFLFKEFESMLKTKEANIAHEIVKNNIILYGIENYYNLISKWMKKE